MTLLPLHGGRAPRWLFSRMVELSRLITEAVIDEYGPDWLVDRLADPQWFQAMSCAVGYDWHSSGTTTVMIGALKEALNGKSDVYIAGGKGKAGIDTPNAIEKGTDYLTVPSESDRFKDLSRTVAKIDSALVYDDIGIYHHAFIFSKNRSWSVVQQGMVGKSSTAIRFQVSGKGIDASDITNETNTAIRSTLNTPTIDLTFASNRIVKAKSLELVNENIGKIMGFNPSVYRLPARHDIKEGDVSDRAKKALKAASDMNPESYTELMKIRGVGRKTLRSLAIISSLIYGEEIYKRDPIAYSYNLGGKDGIPYRISLKRYDDVINKMKEIVSSSRMGRDDGQKVMKRLSAELGRAYGQAAGAHNA